MCLALSANTRPHFTTIAHFISTMDKEIVPLFTKVLSVCYANNVIGKNIFAIDGCTISLSCSKEWSGTKKELLKKAEKIEKSIKYLLDKHKRADTSRYNKSEKEKEQASIEKLKAQSEKIYEWLKVNDQKISFTERMKTIFDTPEARSIYSKRMGTVEPVFGNLRSILRLDRCTLRSKKKVTIQWLLYCMVHTIGKIQRYAEA